MVEISTEDMQKIVAGVAKALGKEEEEVALRFNCPRTFNCDPDFKCGHFRVTATQD